MAKRWPKFDIRKLTPADIVYVEDAMKLAAEIAVASRCDYPYCDHPCLVTCLPYIGQFD